jgi:hypothetical protein
LGSASPHLVRGVSESLAGRVGFVHMAGFDVGEVGPDNFPRLWLRGGLPRSYLAADDKLSQQWRLDFVETFLERDIPQLGIAVPAERLRRFLTMLAHWHGQVWNGAQLARSLGLAEGAVRRHLDVLVGSYIVRTLQPWHENLRKRQVKSPKVYIRDSGLLHALLAVETADALAAHPKFGASWEGFALEQALALSGWREVYFWATHAGAELDLLAIADGRRIGVEFKCADAPKITRSIRAAIEDLRLDEMLIVYPGKQSYPLDQRVRVVAMRDLPSLAGSTSDS